MKNEHASLVTASGEAVVLRSVQATGRLEGLLLSMSLRQTFRNDGPKNIEVTYTFPLAWGAVLLGLEATLGGKRMAGQVIARQEARKQYEDAVEKGDAPIMVEKAQGGVFSASLGSLKPGEEAVIELSYAQLVSFEQGRIRLAVPTTIAPRYGDAVRQGGLQPDQAADPDLLAEHSFGVSITLVGPMARARVASPTHPINLQHTKESDQGTLTVDLQRKAWLDRDFVLLLEGMEGQSFAIAGPDAQSGEGHSAVIASYCPPLPAHEPGQGPSPLALKLLVDCSGSMAGESIELARDALRELAESLRPSDWVSYTLFGSEAKRALPARFCEPHNVEALIDSINETAADLGGTEMESALEDTFALRMPRGAREEGADVLIVTDGDVWGAQRVIDAAQRSGHRVFALGVGSAPAESLLREMAEATGGACEFVTPGEVMAAAVQRLMACIRSPLSVKFNLKIEQDPIWVSAPPTRVAAGETVHTYARIARPLSQAPTLLLEGSSPPSATLTQCSDDLVARLVAARQIGETESKADAKALAEKYQLVTEDTNLLLVFERAEADKTDGMPDLHKVRPMMAAGSSATSSARSMPHVLYSMGGPIADMNVPSVWRNNRTSATAKVDALAAGGMDDLEIPAFLRRAADDDLAPSDASIAPQLESQPSLIKRLFKRKMPTGGAPARMPSTPAKAAAGSATAAEILAAFDSAVSQGLAFRQAIRAVTALTLDETLCRLIAQVGNGIGGPLKAWACYLRLVHDRGQLDCQLSPASLAVVDRQISVLTVEGYQNARATLAEECTA